MQFGINLTGIVYGLLHDDDRAIIKMRLCVIKLPDNLHEHGLPLTSHCALAGKAVRNLIGK